MPDAFQAALAATLAYEGGYSNDPADPGGETYCGVSRVAWPHWIGWTRIDAVKIAHPDPYERNKALRADAVLNEQVAEFYRLRFWVPLNLAAVSRADLAAAVFDMAVNQGIEAAARTLQEAVGAPNDGRIGPETLAAVNRAPETILGEFRARRCVRYAELWQSRPTEAREYGLGWMRRALATG